MQCEELIDGEYFPFEMKWRFTLKLGRHGVSVNVLQMFHYLQQGVCGVVHQHNEGPSSDVVHTPRETYQQDGGDVVKYLLFKVLKQGNRDKHLCVTYKQKYYLVRAFFKSLHLS